MVSIYKGTEFIDYYQIWECYDDFDLTEIEELNFLCHKCISKFSRKHKNKPVSDGVLRQLGLATNSDNATEASENNVVG
jgi:hypothetical protein